MCKEDKKPSRRGLPTLTPTATLLFYPQALWVFDSTHLVPLPSHLHLCSLTWYPVSLPSHLCVYLLTCTPLSHLHCALSPVFLFSPVPLFWHLGPIFSPGFCSLTPSPECVAFLQISGTVRLRYFCNRQVSSLKRKGSNIFF